jgi:hypothetical protein
MKKIFVAMLTLILVLTLSIAAFGLTGPSVTEGHGVITGMFVSDPYSGIFIGAEYGIIPDLAVGGEFGNNSTKLYAKYELNPSVGLLGGVVGGGNANPFIGINAGTAISRDFMILGEIDLSLIGGDFVFMYEAGAKFNIVKQLDVRGGIRGGFGNGGNANSFELGVGFKF